MSGMIVVAFMASVRIVAGKGVVPRVLAVINRGVIVGHDLMVDGRWGIHRHVIVMLMAGFGR